MGALGAKQASKPVTACLLHGANWCCDPECLVAAGRSAGRLICRLICRQSERYDVARQPGTQDATERAAVDQADLTLSP